MYQSLFITKQSTKSYGRWIKNGWRICETLICIEYRDTGQEEGLQLLFTIPGSSNTAGEDKSKPDSQSEISVPLAGTVPSPARATAPALRCCASSTRGRRQWHLPFASECPSLPLSRWSLISILGFVFWKLIILLLPHQWEHLHQSYCHPSAKSCQKA